LAETRRTNDCALQASFPSAGWADPPSMKLCSAAAALTLPSPRGEGCQGLAGAGEPYPELGEGESVAQSAAFSRCAARPAASPAPGLRKPRPIGVEPRGIFQRFRLRCTPPLILPLRGSLPLPACREREG